ncbi:hypothetical protein [Chryseolinea lacunae]|uniref:Lipocalin-like domain-containing protein n=1 Tax=Chryseolinea lacunae TaxID=2801331 RepID=A0ABS1KM54_9BACT|nr:hypothetical protein [Chryseolinea lacunae]MBL0740419.1 hypothetical protein [Chryseolinea lacunae]
MSSACGSDDADEPSVEEQQLARLSKTWVIKSASQDGDRTADFKSPDLTLNVSGTFNKTTPKGPYAYAVSGKLPTPSPWSAQPGLWTFATDTNDVLVRDDGVRIRYVLADKTLTLTFTCATCNEDNGRTNSAEGDWTFVFTAP